MTASSHFLSSSPIFCTSLVGLVPSECARLHCSSPNQFGPPEVAMTYTLADNLCHLVDVERFELVARCQLLVTLLSISNCKKVGRRLLEEGRRLRCDAMVLSCAGSGYHGPWIIIWNLLSTIYRIIQRITVLYTCSIKICSPIADLEIRDNSTLFIVEASVPLL